MANKRANRRTPRSGQGPIKVHTKNGEYATTTWPYQRKDKDGVQRPVQGIRVNGAVPKPR